MVNLEGDKNKEDAELITEREEKVAAIRERYTYPTDPIIQE